ncbi:MAG: PIN domain-containing protein [Chloroflexota bacterium]|nr:PIN domain-containing protein [Chloroflexota bacterium]
MEPDALLDTNILLRHMLQDHVDHSARATALVTAIEDGKRVVRLADTVVFETVFTLEKSFRASRPAIADMLRPILDLPGIVLPGKRIYVSVFDLWPREASLSFADCYHLCLTRQLGLPAILSFDRQLNRLPGVTRIEP